MKLISNSFKQLLTNSNKNDIFDLLLDSGGEKAYGGVVDAILAKEDKEPEIHIILTKGYDTDGACFTKVVIFDLEDQERYAADFTPWGQMANAPIYSELDIDVLDTQVCSEILWELTFYSFTEKGIQEKLSYIEKDVDFIENSCNNIHEEKK